MPKINPFEIVLTLQTDEEIVCQFVGIEQYKGQSYAALLDVEDEVILIYQYIEKEDSFALESVSDEEMSDLQEVFSTYSTSMTDYLPNKDSFFIPGKAKDSCEDLLKRFDLQYKTKRLKPMFKKAIQFIGHNQKKHIQKGLTKIGGNPDVPINFNWPLRDDEPLTFLAQINCEQIAPYDESNLLPKRGMIYFFYNIEYLATYSDGESHAVIYTEESSSLQSLVKKATPYAEVYQYFVTRCSLPDVESVYLSNETEREDYEMMTEWLNEHTQALGNTKWIQDDPLKAIASNSNDAGFNPGDWILLFQLDSVYAANMNWVDDGMIYFFIHKNDLLNKEFNNVKLVLQYY